MIPECREVGVAASRPCGERVYFLTRYLLRPSGDSYDVLRVEPDPGASGLMRPIQSESLVLPAAEVAVHPDRVGLADQAGLVRLARATGRRCTIFFGRDEHVTFVLDPDLELVRTIHVYDVEPPVPSLAAICGDLEQAGLTGELGLAFEYHIRDLRSLEAGVYPCRASGLARSLDRDGPGEGERIACCQTGRELLRETYHVEAETVETCPCTMINAGPFIARCCRSERTGLQTINGHLGTVVHWGATPLVVLDALRALATGLEETG